MILSNDELYIILKRRNLEICEHSSFFLKRFSGSLDLRKIRRNSSYSFSVFFKWTLSGAVGYLWIPKKICILRPNRRWLIFSYAVGRNFRQKSKFSPKIKIFAKDRNFRQTFSVFSKMDRCGLIVDSKKNFVYFCYSKRHRRWSKNIIFLYPVGRHLGDVLYTGEFVEHVSTIRNTLNKEKREKLTKHFFLEIFNQIYMFYWYVQNTKNVRQKIYDQRSKFRVKNLIFFLAILILKNSVFLVSTNFSGQGLILRARFRCFKMFFRKTGPSRSKIETLAKN